MLASVCLFLTAVYLIYKFLTAHYSHWRDRGFPYVEPTVPFGSVKDIVLFRKYQGSVLQEIYRKLGESPYGGYFVGRRPHLMIKDPDIIQSVLIKDFSHFRDRRFGKDDLNNFITQNLFSLNGDKWRALRVKLTPTFSSGKLKMMFPLFQGCADILCTLLDSKAEEGSNIDIKEVTGNFTTDIIGTCAFGLDIGAVENPQSEFRDFGKAIFPKTVTLINKMKLWVYMLIPGLKKIYRFKLLEKKYEEFLFNFVKSSVEYREKNQVVRNDFLNLLIDLKNKGYIDAPEKEADNGPVRIEMNMQLLTAQCFVFFAAGFETSSSVMSYCFYELAINEEIQERLRREIDEVALKHGGINYQSLQEMHYLSQVIDETMRKYPTLPELERICTKNYQLPDSGLTIEKDTILTIPLYSIHNDKKYYPDPEKFDPDRFSPERRQSIPCCTFLPFGEGPRICIGMRFGLLQAKMGVATVLSRYKLSVCEETQIPLKLVPSITVTSVEGPIVLKINKRKTTK